MRRSKGQHDWRSLDREKQSNNRKRYSEIQGEHRPSQGIAIKIVAQCRSDNQQSSPDAFNWVSYKSGPEICTTAKLHPGFRTQFMPRGSTNYRAIENATGQYSANHRGRHKEKARSCLA